MSQNISASDIESVILSLSDIVSVSVILNSSGKIEEIHILTNSRKSPKQIVRDVESALIAKFNIELDHKKISVAQTHFESPVKYENARLKFTEVLISMNGSTGEATVRLSRDDNVYSGTTSGYCSNQNQFRLIASATLNAVKSSIEKDFQFILEDLTIISLGGKDVVVVLVNMITDRGEEYLTGSAIVKQDIWRAVVNATLASVNRRISIIS